MLSYLKMSRNDRYKTKVSRYDLFTEFSGESSFAISTVMKNYIWTPCIWRGGSRLCENFDYADYCALDFENYDCPLDWAVRTFCDCWHIIGTTRNHGISKDGTPVVDRYRVLLKWSRRISTLPEYVENMTRMISLYGSDTTGKDGARIFYPCNEIVSVYDDPEAIIDVEDGPTAQEIEDRKKAMLVYAEHRRSYSGISNYMRRYLYREMMPENKLNNTCFILGCEMYRAGFDLPTAIQEVLNCPQFRGITPEPPRVRTTTANGWRAAENAKRVENQTPTDSL